MLRETPFIPYSRGEIRPAGWLKKQLLIQAQGLCGNLDKIWPDIKDSKWIGGSREGWERVPYWLDGFIPLAYLLDDADMKCRAKFYIDSILLRQQEDGWICPCAKEERARYDMWALILITKELTVYADLSGDERIAPAVEKALYQFNLHLDHNTLFNWAASRWYECLIPIYWLYERIKAPWLLSLAHKLAVQGFDYNRLFDDYRDQAPERKWSQMTHVVNLAMMLKQGALMARLHGGNPGTFARKALDILTSYHGTPYGHFTGDECVSGTSPIQGSELCGVVEAMYSYEILTAYSGDNRWADCLETLAYNALPASVSPDMWTHQYDQQSNQPCCSVQPKEHVVFGTNSGESNLFGLEPNFGCCTANFNQGWPKFAMSVFMATKKGVAITAIAPATLKTVVHGVPVNITVDTLYPFRDTYTVEVTAEKPVSFEIMLRIPGFADKADVDGKPVAAGGFHTIKKTFKEKSRITVSLEMQPRLVERPEGLWCVKRGPLLYAYAPEERWVMHEYMRQDVERKFPFCDWEIFPASPWNYGFASRGFELEELPVGDMPFSPDGAPLRLWTDLAPVPWEMNHGYCTKLPASAVPIGVAERKPLIPYGCTNLRMTELPFVQSKN